jgi:hypothetical protein
MNYLKRYYLFFFFFAFMILLLQSSGCIKEYSFEGALNDTTPVNIPTDTLDTLMLPPAITFSQCSFCNAADEILLGHWSFKTGNAYLCGSFSNSGFFSGQSKTSFTFFGPSACSDDTGLVVSVYLPIPLDQDRNDLTTNRTAFYYYDHNSPNDILASRPPSVFSVTVQSFVSATGIAIGTFSGIAFTATGDSMRITDGRFKALLH